MNTSDQRVDMLETEPCYWKRRKLKVKLSVLSAVMMMTGGTALYGGQEPTNWPVKGETVLNGKGSGVHLKAEFMADVFQVETNRYKLIFIIREPQTGYVWWNADTSLPTSRYAPQFAMFWQNRWREGFCVVDSVGIVELNETHLKICTMKAASLEETKTQVVAGLRNGQKNNLWPMDQHLKDVNLPLRDVLGEDYILDPEDARPRSDYLQVLSLAYTNSVWSIRLKHAYAQTNAVATVELDSDFKIIKASRSDR